MIHILRKDAPVAGFREIKTGRTVIYLCNSGRSVVSSRKLIWLDPPCVRRRARIVSPAFDGQRVISGILRCVAAFNSVILALYQLLSVMRDFKAIGQGRSIVDIAAPRRKHERTLTIPDIAHGS